MSTDFFPTFVIGAGSKPKGAGPIDGVDLMPLLKGEENLERDALFWHYPHYSNQGGFPGGAIRNGDWKLIERLENGQAQLFNLRNDLGEQEDLIEKYPLRSRQMQSALHAWYRKVDAKHLQPKDSAGPAPWRP